MIRRLVTAYVAELRPAADSAVATVGVLSIAYVALTGLRFAMWVLS